MTQETIKQNLRYHGLDWAESMATECDNAAISLHISALSMHPPTPNGTGAWPKLWKSWCNAAKRGLPVDIWLPAPTKIHPATRYNTKSGGEILARGMKIHYVTGNKLLHAKTCVIDAQSIWIGSGNYTAAAAHHNYEAYLRADCPAIARQIIDRWKALA